MLKNIFMVLVHIILNIINSSLNEGIVPVKLKVTTINLIAKIKNTSIGSEFRPLNVPLVMDKVLECAVYEQILHHFEDNKIFYENQSGFRSKHSCKTAIQAVITNWREVRRY